MASVPEGGWPPRARSTDGDVPALELALLALIGFIPTVATAFVFDDVLLIRDSPHAHALSGIPRAFTTYFWQLDDHSRGGIHYYRPLVTASFVVNWLLGSGKPWVFHFTNLVLHAAVTFLVALFARRLTGSKVLAIAVALFSAFHPSRTQSVEWISGRADVLAALFMMASVEFAHHAAPVAKRARSGVMALSVVSFVCALLSKETSVMLPLLVLSELVASKDVERRRTLMKIVVATAVLAVAYALVRVVFFPTWGYKYQVTVLFGLVTICSYAERLFWPWPQTFFHRPMYAENGEVVHPPLVVLGGVVVCAVYLWLLVVTFRKDRASFVLLVAVAAAFGPLLNFVTTGTAVTTFDHYMYLPLLILATALCRAYATPLTAWAGKLRVQQAFGGLLAVYLFVDLLRAWDYRENQYIYLHELELNPYNHFALKAMAEERVRTGDFSKAFEYLVRSTTPASRKYTALGQELDRERTYLRLLSLQAASTADGNVADLERIFEDLRAYVVAQPGNHAVSAASLIQGLDPSQAATALAATWEEREMAASEVAFLATRLGYDRAARASLKVIERGYLEKVPSIHSLLLAYGRLEDFAGASRLYDRSVKELGYRFRPSDFDGVRERLSRAQAYFQRGAQETGVAQRQSRARGYMELGAYLRALRELKPAVDLYPEDADAGQIYVPLLLAAGLDGEARQLLARAVGPDHVQEAVTAMRRQLPPRVLALKKPEVLVDWFTPLRSEEPK